MSPEYDPDDEYAPEPAEEQWWLTAFNRMLVWARLRVMESGVAHVFDSTGNTLVYESADIARAALMDAEFSALDGMDDEDAVAATGMLLDELAPPHGDSDEQLLPQMIRTLGPRHARH